MALGENWSPDGGAKQKSADLKGQRIYSNEADRDIIEPLCIHHSVMNNYTELQIKRQQRGLSYANI